MTVQMRDHSNVRSWEFSCTYRKSLLRILLSLCSIFLLWNFQSREQYEDCDAINSFMSVNQILTKGWTFAFFFTKLVDRVIKFRLSSIWIPRSLTVSSFLKKKQNNSVLQPLFSVSISISKAISRVRFQTTNSRVITI